MVTNSEFDSLDVEDWIKDFEFPSPSGAVISLDRLTLTGRRVALHVRGADEPGAADLVARIYGLSRGALSTLSRRRCWFPTS